MSHWAVVPAAGAGRRMAARVPKQYLTLAGKTLIQHTLDCLLGHPRIHGAVLALAPDDLHWDALHLVHEKPVLRAAGGAERSATVLNALRCLAGEPEVAPTDFVLVHDAARPCLRHEDVDRLLAEVGDDPHGGLLAVPVRDTMKRADAAGRVADTVSRDGLWHAMTPQMFPLGALIAALEDAAAAEDAVITDEAAAMERAGWRPRLVEGHGDNIKITHHQDLALAELLLRQRQREGRP